MEFLAEDPKIVFDIADTESEIESSTETEVGDGDLLGKSYGVIQNREQHGQPHPEVRGAGAERCCHHQRSWNVTVGRLVMFPDPNPVESTIIGPPAHVECVAVNGCPRG